MNAGRNSLYNVAGSVAPLVLALVTIPLYLTTIGTERYGALAIAWLVLGYFGTFDLGLGPATARRISELHDSSAHRRAGVFWTAAAINIAVGTLGGVLLYFGAAYFFVYEFQADRSLISEMLEALPYLAIAVPVATMAGVAKGALHGQDKFLEANVATVVGSSLFQVMPLAVAILWTTNLKWLIIAAVIGRVIGLAVIFARVHTQMLVGLKPRFERAEWLALAKFGGWVSVTTMIGPMMVAADRILIGALLGASAVAIYSVAFDISRRISLIPNAFGVAAFAKFARMNDAENERLMLRSMGALGLLMTAPVVAGLFLMQPFLNIWLGAEIGAQSLEPARLLLIAYWGNSFAVIPFVRIQAQGRPDIVTKATIAQAPFLLAGIYFATKYYGLEGAAFVVAVRCHIEVLILLFLVNKRISMPKSYAFNLVVMAIAYIVASTVGLTSPEGLLAMLVFVLVSGLTSFALAPDESRSDFKILLAKFMPRKFMR